MKKQLSLFLLVISFNSCQRNETQDGTKELNALSEHEKNPTANRMNVAAGLAKNGDLIVVASGWSLKANGKENGEMSLIEVQKPWVSRSKDAGKTWEVNKVAFPGAEAGMTEYIPFGDILPGNDGSLRVLAYAQPHNKAINRKTGQYGVAAKLSNDKGLTWGEEMRVIEDLQTGDCGYPSSVQLPDGKIMTAYYSNGHPSHQRYHMASVIWKVL